MAARLRSLPEPSCITPKLPLTAWFWAAYLMATHSNGISALQLQRQLAFGSYKTAAAALRQAALQHARPGPQPAGRPRRG